MLWQGFCGIRKARKALLSAHRRQNIHSIWLSFSTSREARILLLSLQPSSRFSFAGQSCNLDWQYRLEPGRVYRALGGGWEIRQGEDILPPQIKEIMARRTNWGVCFPRLFICLLPAAIRHSKPGLVDRFWLVQ